ncbi:ricin-type beta-trefoil lectin domain protein [Lysobacter sp. 2RAF19]
MNRICNTRTVVTTLALLGAFASGTASAKSPWTLDAKALTYAHADPVVEQPSTDGSGWKALNSNQATYQVSYATSGETLDPLFPMRIRYEFLSHSPRRADARLFGFQLMDASVVNTSLHHDGQGCAMKGDYLSIGFQWLGQFSAPCGGAFDPHMANLVAVRGAGHQVVDKRPSPVRLACMNYQSMPDERVPEYECMSREEGIAKGFVRSVDATLTPKANNGGFLFDLSLDGHVVYDAQDFAIAPPDRLRFGLFSYVDTSGSAHEVRRVRVTQDALLVSNLDNRCLEAQGGAGATRPVGARTCSGATGQVFRRVGKQLQVGGKCLEASQSPSLNLIAATCDGGVRQAWVRDVHGRLRADGTQMCITVAPGELRPALKTCANAVQQRFLAMTP